MARRRRGCLGGFFFIALLVLAALAAAPRVPLIFLKPRIEKNLSATLGRAVTVDSVRLTVFGGPYLTLQGVTIREDPDFGEGNLLRAPEVQVNVGLADLASQRRLVTDTLTIHDPDIAFVKDAGGGWSWATLGHPNRRATAESPSKQATLSVLGLLLVDAGTPRLRHVSIDRASVRLVDKTGAAPPDLLYKNVALDADISQDEASSNSKITGTLRADSNESDGAEKLHTQLPFNLDTAAGGGGGTTVSGSIGPGRLETANFAADQFRLDCELLSRESANTGKGHISASSITIGSLNVSERIAAAAGCAEIGDMSAGTSIAQLETDFTFDRDVVNTANLRLTALDGLGDASAPAGWFKMSPELTLNYAVTVLFSPQATAQLQKSANPLISAAVGVLSDRNGLAVPLNVTGEVRKPLVQVDLLRALGR